MGSKGEGKNSSLGMGEHDMDKSKTGGSKSKKIYPYEKNPMVDESKVEYGFRHELLKLINSEAIDEMAQSIQVYTQQENDPFNQVWLRTRFKNSENNRQYLEIIINDSPRKVKELEKFIKNAKPNEIKEKNGYKGYGYEFLIKEDRTFMIDITIMSGGAKDYKKDLDVIKWDLIPSLKYDFPKNKNFPGEFYYPNKDQIFGSCTSEYSDGEKRCEEFVGSMYPIATLKKEFCQSLGGSKVTWSDKGCSDEFKKFAGCRFYKPFLTGSRIDPNFIKYFEKASTPLFCENRGGEVVPVK